MDEELKKYRWHLIDARQKTAESVSKYLLTISSGAIAFSLSFVTGYIEGGPLDCTALLIMAWISWAMTITLTIISFYTSLKSIDVALRQTDQESIYKEKPGGMYASATEILGGLAGLFFLSGVVLMIPGFNY